MADPSLQRLTAAQIQQKLRAGKQALGAGLSDPGRLPDRPVQIDAALPAELKRAGAGWTIAAGFAKSPFGVCLLAECPRGICHLSFLEAGGEPAALAALSADWPLSSVVRDDSAATRLAGTIFQRNSRTPLRVFVKGSAFRVRVWRALLQIPAGTLVSYGQLAEAIGQPLAARSVASAVAANTVSYVIPCHRVIRETGALGEFRWGRPRKRAMVEWESENNRLISNFP